MAETLAQGFRRRGHDVALFCRDGSPLHQRLRDEIPCEPVLRGAYFHPGTVANAHQSLRRHAPDVVIGNTMKDPTWSGVAARMNGVPYVYRHEFDVPFDRIVRDRLVYGRIPSRCIVLSHAARKTVLDSARWLEPQRVTLIPNGVDFPGISTAPPLDLGIPDGAVVFGFVGRFDENKGVHEILSAWPAVVAARPAAWLVLAGFGGMEAAVLAWSRKMPNVLCLGFRRDVPSVMRSLDAVLIPSHSEGFCLVAAESMAAGVPVIGTNTSSIPELVEDGVHGRLVPVGNAAALAAAMLELGSDRETRQRMGIAGRDRVQREFSIELMLDRHEARLDEVVSERRRDPL